jgi:TonB-linked SusC/RagA family outer membrane protein
MKKNYLKLTILSVVCLLGILFASNAGAQNLQGLTGTVNDINGEPVIGATIVVSGTQNGTIAGVDGSFTLSNVPSNGTIEVSSIGYVSQKIPVNGQSSINVILEEDVTLLEEVVVVGYGVQKKINVTGAISQISSADMVNRTAENIGQTIQGKMAGVQVLSTSGRPGASSDFRIRGYSSAISSPDPLYLVDGLKVSSINHLDSESIESIEVLKDAASAAIYGAQAGNGVVIITTKKGSQSSGQLFYNSIFTSSVPILAMKMMNASQFKEYWTESGGVNPASFQSSDTDWQDVVMESGFMQRHTFGASNSNDRGSYYVSATYLENDGIVAGDKDYNERVTGQINASYKIKNWLTVGTTNSIERGSTRMVTENNFTGTGSAVGGAYYFDPTVPVFYENDSDVPAASGLLAAEANGDYVHRNEDGKLYGQSLAMRSNLWNPLLMIYLQTSGGMANFNRSWRTNLNGTAYAEITPFAGLTYTSRIGYRLANTYQTLYNPPYWVNPLQISANPYIRGRMDNNYYYQWENFANYIKTIDQHDFTVMAGMEFAKTRMESINATANGLTSLDESFQSLDYYLPNASTRTMGGGDYYRANMSFFGRVTYAYDSKYLFQVNFRADAYDSSKLSKKNRWGYFPSVSLGWVLSKENFMQNIKSVTFLKLRGSYGVNGNINSLSSFAYTTSMQLSGSAYSLTNSGLLSAAAPSTMLANEDLTWEETSQINIGLDSRFFNDRLSFNVDYFDKTTVGMLSSISAPSVSGASSQNVNAGKIQNTGFEFELGWKDNIGKFGYNLSANLATIENIVLESPYQAGRQAGGRNFFLPVTYLEEGYPMWYIRTLKFKEFDANGRAVYYTPEELGTDDGKDYSGSGIPDLTYGLTLGLNWKNIDFTAFGSGVQGNEQFLCIYRPDLPVANLPEFIYNDRWTADDPTGALYPRPDYTDNNRYAQSDFWVFDASYFKIKQLQLGYTFNPSLLRKVNISSLRFYVSAENVYTFTNYPGNDPESMTQSYGNGIGLDKVSYPSTRNYTLGINLTF